MRRHAAYLRFGTTEDEDPYDDLWELHRKYNRVPEPKSPGPGLCTKAMRAVTNLKLTGRMTAAVICLMFVIRFTILEDPTERFAKVVTQERKEHVKKFMGSLKDRFESKRRNATSSLGLTPVQLEAFTLASNLSAPYETMMMPAMWEGWRRMVQAKGPPPKMFQVAVDANLRRWVELMESLDASDLESQTFGSRVACPDSVSAAILEVSRGWAPDPKEKHEVLIPCGLHHDSIVTVVGKPINSFFVNLMAETSVVYQLEAVFHGDGAPFLLQSVDKSVERCPSYRPSSLVDELSVCADALRKPRIIKPRDEIESEDVLVGHFPGLNVVDETWWFPFTQGQPFVLTITFGAQGYHIHVDRNYVSSFLYHRAGDFLQSVSAVRIGGDLLAMSVMANGLYMPKKSILIPDHLKTPSTTLDDENVEMLIGVTSGSVQFERRMGVRRTWAQYPEIRSGRAVLKFFVGLARTKNMNRRIFKEANLFKDVVILPFVDGQKYAVLKTVAMCLFMMRYTQAPYLLKTEDDTFVRVDTVLPAVVVSETRGLLRASIEHKGLPAHEQSPWYSTTKEWPWSSYPKFPRGPGYAISRDIAAFIARQYEDKSLELFRVESVAMGNWVDLYQRQYLRRVSYVDDPTFLNKGCEAGYSIAHGQNLDQMLCLWKRLQRWEGLLCCNNLGAAAK